MKKLINYSLYILCSLFMLSNISFAACCDKHRYKEKASYVFEYDTKESIEPKAEIKDLQKLMLKDKNMSVKMFSMAGAKNQESAPESFKVALSRLTEIQKSLAEAGIAQDRIKMEVKIFIDENHNKIHDKVRIFENRGKTN